MHRDDQPEVLQSVLAASSATTSAYSSVNSSSNVNCSVTSTAQLISSTSTDSTILLSNQQDEEQPISNTSSSSGSRHCSQVTPHLVNRHMVLPFIPPQFASQAADSETLLKPSEYLKSICKAVGHHQGGPNSLSKAR